MSVLLTTLGIVLLDQLTKAVVRTVFVLGEGVPVIPGFFQLTYVRNTGAAWGILQEQSGWLVLFSLVMLIVLAVFRRHLAPDTCIYRVACASMLGGIAGNLIDRIRLGYVVDFLDFFVRQSHFPAFNVADAGICTGVGLFLIGQLLDEWRERAAARAVRGQGAAA